MINLIHICYFIIGDFVSSQDATLTIPQRIKFGEEKLRLGCSPSQSSVSAWSIITHITLSKNSSAGMGDIVTVVLNKQLKNETTWKKSGWSNRVTMNKDYVNPVSGSGIEFDIPLDRVICSDEGTYQCKITGSQTNNDPITKIKDGTVEFQGMINVV